MKNLVFRFYLTVTLCWQIGIASEERSANGYFYDKPEGTLFDESPGLSQLSNSPPIFPPQPILPTTGFIQQLLARSPPPHEPINTAHVEIVPAKLVYEDTQSVGPTINFGLQQQSLQNVQNYENSIFAQPPQVYGVPEVSNLQPIAFTAQDANQVYNNVQQPCGPEPIVAQFNPQLVGLSSGGPLNRIITTCGPNNDCNTISLQSDLNRQLGVLAPQQKTSYGANFQQGFQAQPRIANARIFAQKTPLVRPKGRRLIQYSEIERDDAYN